MSLRRLCWLLMAVLCLLFAPTAAEFYWVNERGGVATYAWLLSVVVSDDFAFGAGSGFAIMTPHWRSMADLLQVVLGTHAVLASIALSIGPFLFVDRLRASRPSLHRRLGQVYVLLVVVAMLLSMVYLAFTPFDRIYGGAPFAVGLWGIAFLTLYTAVMGTVHILRGEVEAHRTVMVLNFAAMLIAPTLRLWWALLGALSSAAVTQADVHVVALMILGVQTFVGAILVVHLTRRSVRAGAGIRRVRAHVSARLPLLSAGAVALGVGAVLAGVSLRASGIGGGVSALETLALAGLLVYLPTRFRRLFGDQPVARGPLWGVVALSLAVALTWLVQGLSLGAVGVSAWGSASLAIVLALALLTFSAMLAYGLVTRRADLVRAFCLHIFALALAPAVLLLFQLGFLSLRFASEDAFLSAAVLAPTLTLSATYYYTAYGSRVRTGQWSTPDRTRWGSFSGLPAGARVLR